MLAVFKQIQIFWGQAKIFWGQAMKKTRILLAEPARAVASVFVFHGLDIAGYGVSHDLNALP
jgi:hypothetical protein